MAGLFIVVAIEKVTAEGKSVTYDLAATQR
ncbi:hypothetical protein J2746_001610 [Methanolobus bombayensis]|nr:hypothetical protein [Methanolobus bombayensis]